MPAFTLYPAIDIKDGKAVRLLQGRMDAATVFNDDPADQARRFAVAGCRWLHLVDLDGAFAGRPVNATSVERIVETIDIPVQLGGGIRDLATIERWLEIGVRRLVLGTVAVRDPDLVQEACRRFPGRIAVGIDARDGRVAVQGWAEESTITAEDLARRFENAGVAAIVFTDITRDGMMEGPNLGAIEALAENVVLPVIASGGVGGPEDIKALRVAADRCSGRIAGAIVGRALYDGRVDLATAIAAEEA